MLNFLKKLAGIQSDRQTQDRARWRELLGRAVHQDNLTSAEVQELASLHTSLRIEGTLEEWGKDIRRESEMLTAPAELAKAEGAIAAVVNRRERESVEYQRLSDAYFAAMKADNEAASAAEAELKVLRKTAAQAKDKVDRLSRLRAHRADYFQTESQRQQQARERAAADAAAQIRFVVISMEDLEAVHGLRVTDPRVLRIGVDDFRQMAEELKRGTLRAAPKGQTIAEAESLRDFVLNSSAIDSNPAWSTICRRSDKLPRATGSVRTSHTLFVDDYPNGRETRDGTVFIPLPGQSRADVEALRAELHTKREWYLAGKPQPVPLPDRGLAVVN